MVIDEKNLFFAETAQSFREFFLRFQGLDSWGAKMKGDFPHLWEYAETLLIGPDIYDEDYSYKVVKVDYLQNLIWLKKQST